MDYIMCSQFKMQRKKKKHESLESENLLCLFPVFFFLSIIQSQMLLQKMSEDATLVLPAS